MAGSDGWIGVDLDGTLAEYRSGDFRKYGGTHIGEPISRMVSRVKSWLWQGRTVKIFTARAAEKNPVINEAIEVWCLQHVGQILEITNVKDMDMIELWDDRAIQVIQNKGVRVDGLP